jgi:hypothetical protein
MFGSVFEIVASRLAFGSIWFLALVPVKETGRGFPRLVLFLALAFLGVAAAWRPRGAGLEEAGPASLLLLAGLALVLPAAIFAPVLPERPARVLLLAASAAGAGHFLALPGASARGDGITGALLLGSVVVSMILGHWYLVSKGLRIRHLVVLTASYVGATVLRGAFAAFSVVPATPIGRTAADLVTGDGLFVLLWIGIGIALPFVVGLLALRTARTGSTQSATGLLYIALVLVLIGELIAGYLGARAGAARGA